MKPRMSRTKAELIPDSTRPQQWSTFPLSTTTPGSLNTAALRNDGWSTCHAIPRLSVVLTVDCYWLSEFGGGCDKPYLHNQEEETVLVRLGLGPKIVDMTVYSFQDLWNYLCFCQNKWPLYYHCLDSLFKICT